MEPEGQKLDLRFAVRTLPSGRCRPDVAVQTLPSGAPGSPSNDLRPGHGPSLGAGKGKDG